MTPNKANKPQERPRLSDFTRPSKKRPQDHNPPDAAAEANGEAAARAALAQEETPPESVTPPQTAAEQEARDRVQLYERMHRQMGPVEDYKKHLEEHDITAEEAARIVDDMMTKGFYEETFKLSKTRYCKLRTRSHRDTIRLQLAMEVQRPLFQESLDELQARYNMAASLSAYNGEEYYFPAPNDSQEKVDKLFDERLKAVEYMPAPLFSAVSLHLAKFDQKIIAVLRPGVAENF